MITTCDCLARRFGRFRCTTAIYTSKLSQLHCNIDFFLHFPRPSYFDFFFRVDCINAALPCQRSSLPFSRWTARKATPHRARARCRASPSGPARSQTPGLWRSFSDRVISTQNNFDDSITAENVLFALSLTRRSSSLWNTREREKCSRSAEQGSNLVNDVVVFSCYRVKRQQWRAGEPYLIWSKIIFASKQSEGQSCTTYECLKATGCE